MEYLAELAKGNLTAIMVVVIVVFAYVMFKREHKSPKTYELPQTLPQQLHETDQDDDSLLPDIEAATSAGELLNIAEEYYFDGEENDAFLKKARQFQADFDAQDWEIILESAEEGSELERVAEELASSS